MEDAEAMCERTAGFEAASSWSLIWVVARVRVGSRVRARDGVSEAEAEGVKSGDPEICRI